MAQFSVNPQRFDKYKNFKFRVKWDGRYVAGVSKVGALQADHRSGQHREGGAAAANRPAAPSMKPSRSMWSGMEKAG